MFIKKVLSLALSLSLLDFQCGWADSTSIDQENLSHSFSLTDSYEISRWVNVTDERIPSSSEAPFVFLIRDVHGDYEAQLNIAKTIEALAEKSKECPLILVEGASGLVDTTFFGSFPDSHIRQEVTKDYVKKGWISGPEYLSISRFGELPMEIWGVEKEDLYLQNFRDFRQVMMEKEETKDWFVEVAKVLGRLKEKLYHKELLMLDQKIQDRLSGKMDLESYVGYLLGTHSEQSTAHSGKEFENLSRFQKIIEEKKAIDFKAADHEKEELLNELSRTLSKEDLSRLIQKSLEYRLGRIEAAAYFDALEQKAGLAGKDFHRDYPELQKSVVLYRQESQIDVLSLVQEMEICEKNLFDYLIQKPEERVLGEVTGSVDLLKKMTLLQMTRVDMDLLEAHRQKYLPENILKTLEEIGRNANLSDLSSSLRTLNSGRLRDTLQKSNSFYETARMRDKVLVDGALRRMKERGISQSILIAGGFHTSGIQELLKSQGAGYRVVSPRVTHEPNEDVYISRMMDERFEVHTLAIPSLFSPMMDVLSPAVKAGAWEEISRIYFGSLMDAVAKKTLKDRDHAKEILKEDLRRWKDSKRSEMTIEERSILSLLEKELDRGNVSESSILSKSDIERFVRSSPVHAETTIQILERFFPDRKQDIVFAKQITEEVWPSKISGGTIELNEVKVVKESSGSNSLDGALSLIRKLFLQPLINRFYALFLRINEDRLSDLLDIAGRKRWTIEKKLDVRSNLRRFEIFNQRHYKLTHGRVWQILELHFDGSQLKEVRVVKRKDDGAEILLRTVSREELKGIQVASWVGSALWNKTGRWLQSLTSLVKWTRISEVKEESKADIQGSQELLEKNRGPEIEKRLKTEAKRNGSAFEIVYSEGGQAILGAVMDSSIQGEDRERILEVSLPVIMSLNRKDYRDKFMSARLLLRDELERHLMNIESGFSKTANRLIQDHKVESVREFKDLLLASAGRLSLKFVRDLPILYQGGPYIYYQKGIDQEAGSAWIGEMMLAEFSPEQLSQFLLENAMHDAFGDERHHDPDTGQGNIIHDEKFIRLMDRILRKCNLEHGFYLGSQKAYAFISIVQALSRQLGNRFKKDERSLRSILRYKHDTFPSFDPNVVRKLIKERKDFVRKAQAVFRKIALLDQGSLDPRLKEALKNSLVHLGRAIEDMDTAWREWREQTFLPGHAESKLWSAPRTLDDAGFLSGRELKAPGSLTPGEDDNFDDRYFQELLENSNLSFIKNSHTANAVATANQIKMRSGKGSKIHSQRIVIQTVSAGYKGNPLLGIPRFRGAHHPQDLIFAYGKMIRGKLHVFVTEAFWQEVEREKQGGMYHRIFAEIIDHEWYENIEGPSLNISGNLLHRNASERARFFADEGSLSSFHEFFINRMMGVSWRGRTEWGVRLFNEKRDQKRDDSVLAYQKLFMKEVKDRLFNSASTGAAIQYPMDFLELKKYHPRKSVVMRIVTPAKQEVGAEEVKMAVQRSAKTVVLNVVTRQGNTKEIRVHIDSSLLEKLKMNENEFMSLLRRLMDMDQKANQTDYSLLPKDMTFALVDQSSHLIDMDSGLISINQALIKFPDIHALLEVGLALSLRRQAMDLEQKMLRVWLQFLTKHNPFIDAYIFKNARDVELSIGSLKDREQFLKDLRREHFRSDERLLSIYFSYLDSSGAKEIKTRMSRLLRSSSSVIKVLSHIYWRNILRSSTLRRAIQGLYHRIQDFWCRLFFKSLEKKIEGLIKENPLALNPDRYEQSDFIEKVKPVIDQWMNETRFGLKYILPYLIRRPGNSKAYHRNIVLQKARYGISIELWRPGGRSRIQNHQNILSIVLPLQDGMERQQFELAAAIGIESAVHRVLTMRPEDLSRLTTGQSTVVWRNRGSIDQLKNAGKLPGMLMNIQFWDEPRTHAAQFIPVEFTETEYYSMIEDMDQMSVPLQTALMKNSVEVEWDTDELTKALKEGVVYTFAGTVITSLDDAVRYRKKHDARVFRSPDGDYILMSRVEPRDPEEIAAEKRDSDETDEINPRGFIQKGIESKKDFKFEIDLIRRRDIMDKTWGTHGDKIVNARNRFRVKRAVDFIRYYLERAESLKYLSSSERKKIARQLETLNDEKYRIFLMGSFVRNMKDFFLGKHDLKKSEMFLSSSLILDLEERGSPTLAYEYILHEFLCPIVGHHRSILIQQKIFPDHYPDMKQIREQTDIKPYKGLLGEALREHLEKWAEGHNFEQVPGSKGESLLWRHGAANYRARPVTLKSLTHDYFLLRTFLKRTPLFHFPAGSQETGMNVWVKDEGNQLSGSYQPRLLASYFSPLLSKWGRFWRSSEIEKLAKRHQKEGQNWLLGLLQEVRIRSNPFGRLAQWVRDYLNGQEVGRDQKTQTVSYVTSAGSLGFEIVQDLVDQWKSKGLVPQDFQLEDYLSLKILDEQGRLSKLDQARLHRMEEVLKPLEHTAVIVPAGAGILAAGMFLALKYLNPDILVIGVVSDRTDAMAESLKTGQIQSIVVQKDILEQGVNVDTPDPYAFEIFQGFVNGLVVVPHDGIENAIRTYAKNVRIMADGASVLPYIALRESQNLISQFHLRGIKDVVLVSMGGKDIDLGLWEKIVTEGQTGEVKDSNAESAVEQKIFELLRGYEQSGANARERDQNILNQLPELLFETHQELHRNNDIRSEFMNLLNAVSEGHADIGALVDWFEKNTAMKYISIADKWGMASKTDTGDGSWGVSQKPQHLLGRELNRLEHIRRMVSAGQGILKKDFAGFYGGLYRQLSGQTNSSAIPNLSPGILEESFREISFEDLMPRMRTLVILGLILHDYGALLKNRVIMDSRETRSDARQPSIAGSVLAKDLLIKLGFDPFEIEVVQFLIRNHNVLWNLYLLNKYGTLQGAVSSDTVVTTVEDFYRDVHQMAEKLSAIDSSVSTDEIRENLLRMLSVISLADVHASGDRYLSDPFVQFVRGILNFDFGKRVQVANGVEKIDVTYESRKGYAKGRAVIMDPGKVKVEQEIIPAAVAFDFGKYSVASRDPKVAAGQREFKRFPGIPFKKFLALSGGMQSALVASNSLISGFWTRNDFLIIDGQMIAKPEGMRGLFEDTFTPVNGRYWVFSFDEGDLGVKEIRIHDGELDAAGKAIQNGVAGPPLVIGGKNVSDWITLGIPPREGNQHVYEKNQRAGMSAIGRDKDGKMVMLHMAGDPNVRNEITFHDFADALIHLGVVEAVALGTSADVAQYVPSDAYPMVEGKPRAGSMSGQDYPEGRPLSAIIIVYPAGGKNADGFIEQGVEAGREFDKRLKEIERRDITQEFRPELIQILESAGDRSDLDSSYREKIAERLKDLQQDNFKTFGFKSIIKGRDDFSLGRFRVEENKLYLSEDVLEKLRERGPPSLADEYLLHELICPVVGHTQAILIQQVLFPHHYPNQENLKSQDSTKPYKGILGEVLRGKINEDAAILEKLEQNFGEFEVPLVRRAAEKHLNPSGIAVEEVVGIKNSYVIQTSSGRRILVVDDHHQVVDAWIGAYKDGLISRGAKLLHLDRHEDDVIRARDFEGIRPLDHMTPEDVRELISKRLGIETFIAPMVYLGVIDPQRWFFIDDLDANPYQERLLWTPSAHRRPMPFQTVNVPVSKSMSELLGQGTVDIVDLDVDIFETVYRRLKDKHIQELKSEKEAEHLAREEIIRDYVPKVIPILARGKVVTIATSPGFIDQDFAIQITNMILQALSRYDKERPPVQEIAQPQVDLNEKYLNEIRVKIQHVIRSIPSDSWEMTGVAEFKEAEKAVSSWPLPDYDTKFQPVIEMAQRDNPRAFVYWKLENAYRTRGENGGLALKLLLGLSKNEELPVFERYSLYKFISTISKDVESGDVVRMLNEENRRIENETFLEYWKTEFAGTKKTNAVHALVNGLVYVGEKSGRDIKIRMYPEPGVKGGVVGVLIRGGRTLLMVRYSKETGPERYDADETFLKSQAGREYDWEWMEGRYDLDKIKKLAAYSNGYDRVIRVKEVYEELVVGLGVSEEEEKRLRSNLATASLYIVLGSKGREDAKRIIELYLGALKMNKEDLSTDLKKQLSIAVYHVVISANQEALQKVFELYGKRLGDPVPESLRKQWLIATYIVAMKGNHDSLEKVIDHYGRVFGNDIPEDLKQQWLIATYEVAMSGNHESLDKVINLYSKVLGDPVPVPLRRSWLIATYNVAMHGNHDSLDQVIKLYERIVGSPLPESLKQQWLIATYEVAMNRNHESLDEVIKLYTKILGESVPEALRQPLLMATYNIAMHGNHDSLKQVIELYGKVLGLNITENLKEAWLTATYNVAMKGSHDSLKQVIELYGRVFGKIVPEGLKQQWLIATSNVAKNNNEESLERVIELYGKVLGENVPEALRRQWLIATYAIAMKKNQDSLKRVVELYGKVLGEDVPEQLLHQWLIATYKVAMSGNDESLEKVIDLYKTVLGGSVPDGIRSSWMIATYEVALSKNHVSLRRVIELYRKVLGEKIPSSLKQSWLTATYNVAMKGNHESLEKVIELYGRILGKEIPEELMPQWLTATYCVAKLGDQELLEKLLFDYGMGEVFKTLNLNDQGNLLLITSYLVRMPENEKRAGEFIDALKKASTSEAKTQLIQRFKSDLYRTLRSESKETEEDRTPSQGYSGLPDTLDESPYRPVIRDAVEKGLFKSVTFDGGRFGFTRVDIGDGITPAESPEGIQAGAGRETETVRKALGKEPTREELEALNNTELSTEDRSLLYGVTILFVEGLDEKVKAKARELGLDVPEDCRGAHYGISRRQIYLDASVLSNQADFLRQLHHELFEQSAVLEVLDSRFPDWQSSRDEPEVIHLIQEASRHEHQLLERDEIRKQIFDSISAQPNLGNNEELRAKILHFAGVYGLIKHADFRNAINRLPWIKDVFTPQQIDLLNRLLTRTSNDVARHQLRSTFLASLMLHQYSLKQLEKSPTLDRDTVLLAVSLLVHDISKGFEPVKSVIEKGRGLTESEKGIIRDHGRISVDVMNENNFWKELRSAGLVQSDEEQQIIKMLVLYHVNLSGFQAETKGLEPKFRDRIWLLLSFLRLADAMDAANDRSRPYNMHRPAKSLRTIYREESDPFQVDFVTGEKRVLVDDRALFAFDQIINDADSARVEIEELAHETDVYHEVYTDLNLLRIGKSREAEVKSLFGNRISFNPITGEVMAGRDFGFNMNNDYCLVRHGETDWNTEDRLQGSNDIPLNSTGLDQVSLTAESLLGQYAEDIKTGKPPVIYSSPLKRAQSTALAFVRLVKERLNVDLEIHTEPELREISWGTWEGKKKGDCKDEDPDLFSRFYSGKDFRVGPPGTDSESPIDILIRMEKIYREIDQRHRGQKIIVFGHGRAHNAAQINFGERALVNRSGQLHYPMTRLKNGEYALYSNENDSSWVNENAPQMKEKLIVEVTMEMALSDEIIKRLQAQGLSDDELRATAMSTSVGGIGSLLGERIIAQSNLGADVAGFSLLYDKVWVQKIQGDGTLTLEKVEVGKHLRKVLEEAGLINVTMYDGREVTVKVWKSPRGAYGKGTVYFLDLPEITDSVYPGDRDYPGQKERIRFDQSWLLGRGTLAWMKQINQKCDLVVMSEAPTMFAHHRIFQDQFTDDPLFKETQYVFNDHTPLEYAHPHWNRATLEQLKVDSRYTNEMPIWVDPGKRSVDATALIINAADGVYGVAEKHGRVMREMPLLRQFGDKIKSITNGVSPRYWPSDAFGNLKKLQSKSDTQLLEIKQGRRDRLIRWLAQREGLGAAWADQMIRDGNPVGVWTRRIVEYKRLDRLSDVLENDAMREEFIKTGVVLVFGGRIHQDDSYGLRQFNRIEETIRRDSRLKGRVIFLENYNTWEAPILFQGTDFSLMLADDGREASATGFQKAQMNGALVIANEDGAIPESVSFFDGQNLGVANGFNVPFVNGVPTAEGFLDALAKFSRVFYDKPSMGRMVRNALNQTHRVSVRRTAQDMMRFFSGILTREALKNLNEKDGERFAEDTLDRMNFSHDEAADLFQRLDRLEIPPFEWKYREGNVAEKTILRSNRNLAGFFESYNTIEILGSVGEWSMAFHAHNKSGRGDLIDYLVHVFNEIQGMKTLVDELSELGRQAQKSDSTIEKIRFNKIAISFTLKFMKLLRDKAVERPASSGEVTSGTGVLSKTLGKQAPMMLAAESVVQSGLLARRFVDYDVEIQSITNPDGEDMTIVYGGSGPDISSVLIATNFTRGYFMNEVRDTTVEGFDTTLQMWDTMDLDHQELLGAYFRGKYQDGYAEEANFAQSYLRGKFMFEFFIIQELRTLGVQKEDIKYENDALGRVHLTFRIPGEARAREIVFVKADLLSMSQKQYEDLSGEFKGKVNVYYEKAVWTLPASYDRYLPKISEWIGPKGFLVVSPFDNSGVRHEPMRVLAESFKARTSERLEALTTRFVGKNPYGLVMEILQKRGIETISTPLGPVSTTETGPVVSESRDLSKEDQAKVRGQIFIHQDGIALGPVMTVLNGAGVFDLFAGNQTVTIEEILDKTKGNEGYLHVAMRLLVSQGWATREGKPGTREMKYTLTPRGKIAVEMAKYYREVIPFIPTAVSMDQFLFDQTRAPPDAEIELYKELVEKSKRDWDIPEETDPERTIVRQQVIQHLNGMLTGPTIVALGMRNTFKKFDAQTHSIDITAIKGNERLLVIAFELLASQGWFKKEDNKITMTPRGDFATGLATAYGVTVSYLPTFGKLPDLLFGDPSVLWKLSPEGHETHVNRTMNVWGSGGAHKTYFKKIDEIIIEIFNRPLEEQPKGIADMGCGDGTLLKHLYEVVRTRTERGKHLDTHPLMIVGGDFNEAARVATEKTLSEAGIPEHHVVFGDINDPDSFAGELKTLGVDAKDILHVRSFLDHNRPYIPPDSDYSNRVSLSTGAYVHKGKVIPNEALQQNLVEHFKRWAPYVGKYGLLLLELHSIPPELAAKSKGKTLATPYDADHGFSDQYTVEIPEFFAAAKEAGIEADERFQARFPPGDLATVSINYFRARPQAVSKAMTLPGRYDDVQDVLEKYQNTGTRFHMAFSGKSVSLREIDGAMTVKSAFENGEDTYVRHTYFKKEHIQEPVDALHAAGASFDGKRLLYVGPGPTLSEVKMLLELIPKVGKLILIEPTLANVLSLTAEILGLPEELRSKIEIYRSTVENLPLADNSVDFVFSNEVLVKELQKSEFIDLDQAWQAVHRILSPGGYFFGYSNAPAEDWMKSNFMQLTGSPSATLPRILQKPYGGPLTHPRVKDILVLRDAEAMLNKGLRYEDLFPVERYLSEFSAEDKALLFGHFLRLDPRPDGQYIAQDRYMFEDLVGAGHQGIVFKVKDLKTQESLALKLSYGATLPEKEAVKKLSKIQREGRVHPQILKVLHSGEVKGRDALKRLFILTEFVQIKELIDLKNAVPNDEYLFNAQDHLTFEFQILNALEYLLKEGILLYDPQVALTYGSDGARAVLLDYELSKVFDDLSGFTIHNPSDINAFQREWMNVFLLMMEIVLEKSVAEKFSDETLESHWMKLNESISNLPEQRAAILQPFISIVKTVLFHLQGKDEEARSEIESLEFAHPDIVQQYPYYHAFKAFREELKIEEKSGDTRLIEEITKDVLQGLEGVDAIDPNRIIETVGRVLTSKFPDLLNDAKRDLRQKVIRAIISQVPSISKERSRNIVIFEKSLKGTLLDAGVPNDLVDLLDRFQGTAPFFEVFDRVAQIYGLYDRTETQMQILEMLTRAYLHKTVSSDRAQSMEREIPADFISKYEIEFGRYDFIDLMVRFVKSKALGVETEFFEPVSLTLEEPFFIDDMDMLFYGDAKRAKIAAHLGTLMVAMRNRAQGVDWQTELDLEHELLRHIANPEVLSVSEAGGAFDDKA